MFWYLWHFCQRTYCCQSCLSFLSKFCDKSIDIFDTVVTQNMAVKIVRNLCETKYGSQISLIFLSKLSDTSFDTFDTFVRQNIAVEIVWHFCQNCLIHVFHFWHFCLAHFCLSKLSDIFVKIVWHKFWQFWHFCKKK